MNAVVAIVTHNRPSLLARTLESLSQCERPEAFRNVLVVENGSDDGSRKIVAGFGSTLPITYRRIDSPAKSEALNEVLRLVDDELVIFLDDDVRIAPRLLRAYCDCAERSGSGHYFGGPTGVDYDDPPADWLRRFLPSSAVGFSLATGDAAVRYPTCFLGFNWAAFSNDLKSSGGFSSRFGPGTAAGGGDESFVQLRLTRRGMVGRYVPEAMVWHFVPRERCSPAWTLARAQSGGICAGVFEEHRHRLYGRRLSKGRVLLRQVWRRSQTKDLRDLLLLRSGGRFWFRYTARWMAGFRRGLSLGAQEKPLDEDQWQAAGFRSPAESERPELSSCS
jgi:glycosyltransferase involved in cell wall biosynthesis